MSMNETKWTKKIISRSILISLLISLTVGMHFPASTAHAADEYDSLRNKWQELLVGSSNSNADTDIAARIAAITDTANASWTTMNTSSSRTSLWSDLTLWTSSATMTSTYNRLKGMSIAYATPGSSLYNNASLAGDIISGLNWMYSNKYNASKSQSDNWWDWQIGTPQALGDIMVLMYNQLSTAQLTGYIQTIDKFVADPTKRYNSTTIETGANRTDKAQVVVIRGILDKSSAKIAQARDALSQVFLYVTNGDGFYTDGSFIQHTNIAYNGSYGRVLLAGLSKLLYTLSSTTWQVTDPNVGNVYDWVSNAYQPLIYKGAMMDMVRGRAISRDWQQDHVMGRDVILSINRLALAAPAAQKLSLQRLVKGWAMQDTTFDSYYEGIPISDIIQLKTVMSDAAILPASELNTTKVYNEMARAVQVRPQFAAGISMFSSRIGRYEASNDENVHGWHTGEGMTYLYNADLTQYSQGYWATVNPYRLAGITVDPLTLSNAQGSASTSTYNFVGGVSNGSNGVVGMRFTGMGTDLTGRKSWFLFGNKLIALGSSITSTSGRSIETIVENRKLNNSGTNTLTVGGAAKSSSIGWSETMSNVSWAHLQGSVTGSDIGYYFPGSTAVTGLREVRSGAWSDINTGGSTASITNHFLSLAINHGNSPTDASYAYVLLPGRTAAETAAYASNPDIIVLENSTTAQAVKDLTEQAVGINFWTNTAKTVAVNGTNYITSNKQASVLITEKNNQIELVVSDPTQSNTGSISLELNKSASAILSADSGITVTQTSPTIKLTIQVNGANGAAFRTILQK